MENTNLLLKELEIKIEAIKFKYETLFKNSSKTLEEFLQENYQKIRSELAKISTETLHLGILNNTSTEEFIEQTLTLNFENVYKLLNDLKKISEEK